VGVRGVDIGPNKLHPYLNCPVDFLGGGGEVPGPLHLEQRPVDDQVAVPRVQLHALIYTCHEFQIAVKWKIGSETTRGRIPSTVRLHLQYFQNVGKRPFQEEILNLLLRINDDLILKILTPSVCHTRF
jgi:hypothetical protein